MPKRAAPDSPAELDNAKISCRADFQEIAARYHRDQLVLIEGGGAANWSFAELAAAWADAPAWVAAEWQVEAGGAKLTPEHVLPRLQAGGLVHPQGQWYVSTVLQDDDARRLRRVMREAAAPAALANPRLRFGEALWVFLGENDRAVGNLDGRPEHTDEVFHSGTVHVQTSGAKLWCVRPHEAHAWPAGAPPKLGALRVLCRAGDALLINTRLWRHATALPPSPRQPLGAHLSFSHARDFWLAPPGRRPPPPPPRRAGPAMTNESGPVASRALRAGEIILSERPLAAVQSLDARPRGRCCAHCCAGLRRPPETLVDGEAFCSTECRRAGSGARELVRAGGRDKAHIHRRVATAALRVGQYETVRLALLLLAGALERGGVDEAQALLRRAEGLAGSAAWWDVVVDEERAGEEEEDGEDEDGEDEDGDFAEVELFCGDANDSEDEEHPVDAWGFSPVDRRITADIGGQVGWAIKEVSGEAKAAGVNNGDVLVAVAGKDYHCMNGVAAYLRICNAFDDVREAAREHAREIVGDDSLGWSWVGVPFRFARCGGGRRATPDPARALRALCGLGAAVARELDGQYGGLSAVLGSAQFERLLAAVHAHSWQLDAPEHDDGEEGGGGGVPPAFEGRAWFDVLGSVPAAAQPNCALALVHDGGPLRATLTALRDIAPGEGLTIGV